MEQLKNLKIREITKADLRILIIIFLAVALLIFINYAKKKKIGFLKIMGILIGTWYGLGAIIKLLF